MRTLATLAVYLLVLIWVIPSRTKKKPTDDNLKLGNYTVSPLYNYVMDVEEWHKKLELLKIKSDLGTVFMYQFYNAKINNYETHFYKQIVFVTRDTNFVYDRVKEEKCVEGVINGSIKDTIVFVTSIRYDKDFKAKQIAFETFQNKDGHKINQEFRCDPRLREQISECNDYISPTYDPAMVAVEIKTSMEELGKDKTRNAWDMHYNRPRR